MDHELTIVFEPADEAGFVSTIPEAPDNVSEGETIEEARAVLLDAALELSLARRSASTLK